jgi:hypothetical protein
LFARHEGDTIDEGERKKIYVPSATLAAVQAEEASTASAHPTVSSGAYEVSEPRKQIVIPSAKLEAMSAPPPQQDDKKKYTPSETFKLVQKLDKGEDDEHALPKSHSKAFARLQKNLE